MKYDIILTGVGGQGVLSISAGIAKGAMLQGLKVRQSEVHGMAQRGGTVISHMRISDREIAGDLIGTGSADMILSMEPLEALRYLSYLSPEGKLVTAAEPVLNIPDYPDIEEVLRSVRETGASVIIAAIEIAKQSGNPRAANMAIVGAASNYIPVDTERIEDAITDLFSIKGASVVEQNLKAYRAGRVAGKQ